MNPPGFVHLIVLFACLHAAASAAPVRELGEVRPSEPSALEEVAAEYARDRADGDAEGQWPLLALGERELADGQPQRATATLKEALKQYSKEKQTRGRVLLALGRAHAAARERSLALACFDLVLRDGPASLASEAQLQRALLESSYLLTPRRFRAVLASLALESPMTLDFDMLRYLVGSQRGYRLDRVDTALLEFQKCWEKYPKGARAADAMLHQALIEGLVLSRLAQGWDRLKQLVQAYPQARNIPIARVAQATLAISQGDIERALKVLALVPEDSDAAPEAIFLAALLTSYYMDEPEPGADAFRKLETLAGGSTYGHVAIYHQAVLKLAAGRDPAGAKATLGRLPEPPARPETDADRALVKLSVLKRSLASSIDHIAEQKDEASRKFAFASFWYGHHHFTRALRELNEFLKENPGHSLAPRAKFMLGKIQQEDVPRPVKARAALTDSLEGTPSALRGEIEWRRASSLGGDEAAQRPALQAIYQDDDNPFKPLAGVELARQGAMDERGKRELLHQVLEKEPSGDVRAKLLSQLARAYRDAGNPRRALEVYQSALPFDSALGPEITKTRTLLEIQDLEGKLARGQLVDAKVTDPGAQLQLGRLYLSLGREDDAKAAFRAVLKALPRSAKTAQPIPEKRKRARGDDEDLEPTARTSPLADAARLELMKLNVKHAKFPTQALRYANDYLKEIGRGSKYRAEGVAVKVEVLEREYDPDGELLPSYRYLVNEGYKPELYAIKLAKALVEKNDPAGALAVLERVKWGRDHGPEGLLLTAELQGKVGKRGRAADTLQVLASRYPESPQGKEGGARLAQLLGADLELAAQKRVDDPPGLARALQAFFARMKPEWVGAARVSIEKVTGEPYVSAIPPAQLERFVELLASAKDIDPKLLARVQEQAAKRAAEPLATQYRVDQAIALATAGEAERAVTMLTELAPRSPSALLHVAILQEREFKDPQAALSKLDELLARPDVPPAVRTKAVLRRAALDPKGALPLLEAEAQRIGEGPARALVYEKLAQLVGEAKDAESSKRAAQYYLAAAKAAADNEDKVRLTLEGAKRLIDVKAYPEASAALRSVDVRDAEGDPDPRIQQFFLRSEALAQLERLQRGVNWDDPENPTNMRIMLAQARLLISPLREYDRAQALLAEIEPFFPKTASGEVASLRREMSHRWQLRALEDKEEKLPRDLMELAVSLEEELGDAASAARYLKELIAKHPKDPLALIARLRLIRLFALKMNRKADAAKLALGLGQIQDAADFKPELAAAFNLVVAQSQYEQDVIALDRATAADPRGSPEMIRVLARMGRTAVVDFRDQKLATEVLQRLLVYRDGPVAEDARREGYKLAVLAAIELNPLKAAVYAMSERARLLATALELAQDGEQKARVLLEQGLDHLREQDMDRAAKAFDAASREAPASPYGREALFNLAQVETKRKNLDKARDAYARLADSGARKPLVKLASKQIPKLEKLSRSAEREIVLAQAPQLKTPYEYYRTAKEQLHEDDDLEGALVNFRTYLRLGKEQKNLVDAYLETAEVLVRLERPKEALEVLNKAIGRYPEDRRAAEMNYKLGQLYEVQLADVKAAEKVYKQVRKDHPKTKWAGEAQKALGRLTNARKERKAGQAVALGQSSIAQDIAAIKKKYLKERGNFTDAIEALKSQAEAASTPDDRAQIYFELATIHEVELRDYEQAVTWYQKFIEESGDSIKRGEVLLKLASLKAEQLREPEEALEIYKEFQDKHFNHPRRIDGLLAMAQLHEKKLNDVQAAINIYRNIADSYPRSGYDEQALIRIAELSRTHFADYPGAVEALRRLVRDYPFSPFAPSAQWQIANILEVELGDKAAAQIEYQRLIDSYPQSGLADGARQALVRLRGRQ